MKSILAPVAPLHLQTLRRPSGITKSPAFVPWWFVLIWLSAIALGENPSLFTDHGDVGTVKHAGSFEFDPGRGAYTVAGGGANMWAAVDAFHFVWKKVSGDATLAADISFEGTSGEPHRKACLLIRQSLDADSPYADAALHGDGLTSLQYRDVKGERTYEIQANVSAPKRLRIEKRGRYVSMWLAGADGELHPAGGAFRLELTEPFYIGLGVCAHNDEALEKAVFTNVELKTGALAPTGQSSFLSVLETVKIASKDRRAVWTTGDRVAAPVWSHDGAELVFHSGDRLQRIPVVGGEPRVIDTGFVTHCGSDHGISPDGATLVFSGVSQAKDRPRIYTMPIGGGAPRLLTDVSVLNWHSWSPDGKTLAFDGEHNGEFGICTTPANGGAETRLTVGTALAGSPDYSADGQWIYFHSNRTGREQIWRMHADGSGQEQVTNDEFHNAYPHPSPDGKWLVFLSAQTDFSSRHDPQDVTLRIMPLAGGKVEILAKLLGEQGTIPMPCWSPDSLRVAFVSDQPRP